MKFSYLLNIILICLLGSLSVTVNADATEKSWNFKVLLDDNEIGRHTFKLRQENEKTYVSVKADFDVKFLFISVYTYEHQNKETWHGKCLASISSNTNDNGELFSLRGESTENTIRVETASGTERFEGCVKTFSYWDPDFLNSKHLLNAQTGELMSVEVERLGETNLQVQGSNTSANHYRLITDEFSVELWYSPGDQEWLALQSTTRDGTVLKYEKIKES